MRLLTIHPSDNVAVDTDTGFKIARRDIAAGERIIKYGNPIGEAVKAIPKGTVVHTDNMRTLLRESEAYEYQPEESEAAEPDVSGISQRIKKHRPRSSYVCETDVLVHPQGLEPWTP